MQPDSSMNNTPDFSAIIADALQQQALQFEAIVNGLQLKIDTLSVQQADTTPDTSKKSKSSKVTSSGKDTPLTSAKKAASAPKSMPHNSRSPPVNPYSTLSAQKASKIVSTSNKVTTPTPSPIRKCAPLQLLVDDTPKDFKQMKDALYVHMKTMWGLFKPDDIPAPPDKSLLKEFHSCFTNEKQIDDYVEDPQSPNLIAQNDILTLRAASAGGDKLGHSMGRLDEVYVLYIHAALAKVGIWVWGPDLCTTHDSLYNLACHITALASFHQLCGVGAYDHMNVNLRYVNNLMLLVPAYNHYVHFVLANKFKTKMKEQGRVKLNNEKRSAQKARERLRDAQVEYLLRHCHNVPPHYLRMAQNILAHSDDEDIPSKNALAIKTLTYHRKNASKFWRWVDIECIKEAQVSGKQI
ncbi:hypothetical protein CROQUDRAFT_693897 [Cronartium quercuum f. sp. fusiforme G11]|uniref:Uncharacterized protein n=1 Tax=Cronartium quercuum f. sp. fusiforme G11 TaxID=708437 RepID=A0A9P6TGX8_9BASI|nr:hypothetical protein CROQUDRAFT_693897 [Cronartium quercuum f. sp. fusiforme G11]